MVEKTEYPVNELRSNIPKIFLEVEVFDLNLEKGKEVSASFGVGADFESFGEAEKMAAWSPMGQLFQAVPKRESRRKCHMPQRTVDPSRCEKRRPYCDLSCPRLSATSPGTIRIQASRKYVADHYDDGERAWNKDQAVEDKQGDWPEAVQISQSSEPWPTEEILTQIVFYTQSLESTYNEEKTKEVMPLLNKILILQQKDGKIEYVIDRFVSV